MAWFKRNNGEHEHDALIEECQRWKDEATKHEKIADYWAVEAARMRSELKAPDVEQELRNLNELLSYWKTAGIAKEKELREANREIVELREQVRQLKVLIAEDRKKISLLHKKLAGAETEE